jgi:hypothetical protein
MEYEYTNVLEMLFRILEAFSDFSRGWSLGRCWNLTTPHLTCRKPSGRFPDIRTAEANVSFDTFFLVSPPTLCHCHLNVKKAFYQHCESVSNDTCGHLNSKDSQILELPLICNRYPQGERSGFYSVSNKDAAL